MSASGGIRISCQVEDLLPIIDLLRGICHRQRLVNPLFFEKQMHMLLQLKRRMGSAAHPNKGFELMPTRSIVLIHKNSYTVAI